MTKTSLFLSAVLFCVLQWSWMQLRGTVVERVLVHDLTVGTATRLINMLTPQVQAHTDGAQISAAGGGINVLNGCEGTEVLWLLWAALASYPGTWRARVVGLLAGTAFVFVLNQARLVVLFYSFRHDPALFAQLHGLVTPLLMVVSIVVFFVLWARWQGGRPTATAAPL
jgi:exosortase family protein XrtM